MQPIRLSAMQQKEDSFIDVNIQTISNTQQTHA